MNFRLSDSKRLQELKELIVRMETTAFDIGRCGLGLECPTRDVSALFRQIIPGVYRRYKPYFPEMIIAPFSVPVARS